MKSYFYKHISKGLISAVLFSFAVPLFAANFAEQRRVVLPQTVNAVYRDLRILDELKLNTTADKIFLLELGKRPTYFWSPEHMFNLYQKQEFNVEELKQISNGSPTSESTFVIGNVNLGSGSFLANHLKIKDSGVSQNDESVGTSTVSLSSNSNLLLSSNGTIVVNFQTSPNQYNFYTREFVVPVETTLGKIMDNLYLRDVEVKLDQSSSSPIVKFMSPRMMIYEYVYSNETRYRAIGKALKFELKNVGRTSSPKHYYGPWENWGPSQGSLGRVGRIRTNGTSNSDVCPRTNYCVGDSYTTEFTCTDTSSSDLCYDYKVVNIKNALGVTDENDPRLYNNNRASYEFKVEEVYQYDPSIEDTRTGNVELVSQIPVTRVRIINGETTTLPFSKHDGDLPGSWDLYNIPDAQLAQQHFYIDGQQVFIPNVRIHFVGNDDVNPCFTVCNGKLCQQEHVYIRTPEQRELIGGPNAPDSTWPEHEGAKQNLIIRTYTVGFCPEKRTDADYLQYEKNYVSNNNTKLIEALKIKSGTQWTANAKFCVRRKVRCNAFSGNTQYFKRDYTPLSTDH